MRCSVIAICLILSAGAAGSAAAQVFNDAAICGRLTEQKQSGLFIVYPANSRALMHIQNRAICAVDGSFCAAEATSNSNYEPVSRFFYLPGRKPRSEEGVWHIRTQTLAANLQGADFAYVARPSLGSTRCSLDSPVPGLSGEAAIVSVNRYIDHHPKAGQSQRSDTALNDSFHFDIRETPTTCVRTNDTAAFRNLHAIYGFENVDRTEQVAASWFSISAVAGTTQYAGLSSEFAYRNEDENICFGFAAPFPTKSNSYANNTWQPRETLVVIKRLRGTRVEQAIRSTVTWRR